MGISIEWLCEAFPEISKVEPLEPGGQKWAFRCHHCDYGLSVLKLIKPGAARRIDRELEAVVRLSQRASNIPQIFKTGCIPSQVGPLIWLLEAWVGGNDLSEILTHGPLNRQNILKVAIDLISIAADAESVKVVHRDIKPRNIKIDETNNTWLLDFGIARILDLESKTPTEAFSGPHSPGYSPPEQFRYQKYKIDGRSDLFAIGVVLYECSTGKNPFLEGARDRLEILRRVELDPLPKLNATWDREGIFSDFILTLTQKYPYQRPCSCTEALKWIQEIVNQFGGL